MDRCPHSFNRVTYATPSDSLGSDDDLHLSREDDGAVTKKQDDARDMELSDAEHGDYGLMKLAKKIARLLSALPDNQLTSFR